MKVLKHQQWHFLSLALLLSLLYYLPKHDQSIQYGKVWELKTSTWFIIAILFPILHQIYVLVCWRIELFYNSISKAFGKRGFVLYKVGFALLFISRLISICILAVSNSGTLSLDSYISYTLALVCMVLSFYLFYSVKKYFGIDRAFGIDHFYPEDLRGVPFVKNGIFKLMLFSKAAILVAIFNHVYIWVHYYFTELPDMKIIYTDS